MTPAVSTSPIADAPVRCAISVRAACTANPPLPTLA
jgi:hypothetical protein